jgi:hypothetical protein
VRQRHSSPRPTGATAAAEAASQTQQTVPAAPRPPSPPGAAAAASWTAYKPTSSTASSTLSAASASGSLVTLQPFHSTSSRAPGCNPGRPPPPAAWVPPRASGPRCPPAPRSRAQSVARTRRPPLLLQVVQATARVVARPLQLPRQTPSLGLPMVGKRAAKPLQGTLAADPAPSLPRTRDCRFAHSHAPLPAAFSETSETGAESRAARASRRRR